MTVPDQESIVLCFDEPWLLDSEEKVKWSNGVVMGYDEQFSGWVLGDHCWFRPRLGADG
jgi:hypothetical protein